MKLNMFLRNLLGVAIFVVWYLKFDDGQGMPIGVLAFAAALFIPWHLIFCRKESGSSEKLKKAKPEKIKSEKAKPKKTKQFRFPPVLDAYRQNPYQVLGLLPSETTMKALSSRKDHLAALIRADLPPTRLPNYYAVAWPGGNGGPTEEEVRRAYSQLENDKDRIGFQMLWFQFEASPNGDFELLATGDFKQARKKWTFEAEQHADKKKAARALHNRAVLEHALTMAREGETLGPIELPRHQVRCWERSLKLWKRVNDTEEYWNYVSNRVKASNDPSVDSTYSLELRRRFPRTLLKFHYDLAATAISQKRIQYAKQHLQLARKSGFDQEARTPLEVAFYQSAFGRQFDSMLSQLELCVGDEEIESREEKVNDFLSRANEIRRMAREVEVEKYTHRTAKAIFNVAYQGFMETTHIGISNLHSEAIILENKIGRRVSEIIDECNNALHYERRSVYVRSYLEIKLGISSDLTRLQQVANSIYEAIDEATPTLASLLAIAEGDDLLEVLSRKKQHQDVEQNTHKAVDELTTWVERQKSALEPSAQ